MQYKFRNAKLLTKYLIIKILIIINSHEIVYLKF